MANLVAKFKETPEPQSAAHDNGPKTKGIFFCSDEKLVFKVGCAMS